MGCVSFSRQYFPDGSVTRGAMKEAEVAARNELQPLIGEFGTQALAAGGRLFRHDARARGDRGRRRVRRRADHPRKVSKSCGRA